MLLYPIDYIYGKFLGVTIDMRRPIFEPNVTIRLSPGNTRSTAKRLAVQGTQALVALSPFQAVWDTRTPT